MAERPLWRCCGCTLTTSVLTSTSEATSPSQCRSSTHGTARRLLRSCAAPNPTIAQFGRENSSPMDRRSASEPSGVLESAGMSTRMARDREDSCSSAYRRVETQVSPRQRCVVAAMVRRRFASGAYLYSGGRVVCPLDVETDGLCPPFFCVGEKHLGHGGFEFFSVGNGRRRRGVEDVGPLQIRLLPQQVVARRGFRVRGRHLDAVAVSPDRGDAVRESVLRVSSHGRDCEFAHVEAHAPVVCLRLGVRAARVALARTRFVDAEDDALDDTQLPLPHEFGHRVLGMRGPRLDQAPVAARPKEARGERVGAPVLRNGHGPVDERRRRRGVRRRRRSVHRRAAGNLARVGVDVRAPLCEAPCRRADVCGLVPEAEVHRGGHGGAGVDSGPRLELASQRQSACRRVARIVRVDGRGHFERRADGVSREVLNFRVAAADDAGAARKGGEDLDVCAVAEAKRQGSAAHF
mmetsp:Transcript_27517/g.92431  ORF Transcript_27517/g.92431 Transcript_27517/m.92431 type:complete len:464 (-) Transcript_27517:40-1431(-)